LRRNDREEASVNAHGELGGSGSLMNARGATAASPCGADMLEARRETRASRDRRATASDDERRFTRKGVRVEPRFR
jgi:hypothetical protein